MRRKYDSIFQRTQDTIDYVKEIQWQLETLREWAYYREKELEFCDDGLPINYGFIRHRRTKEEIYSILEEDINRELKNFFKNY